MMKRMNDGFRIYADALGTLWASRCRIIIGQKRLSEYNPLKEMNNEQNL